MVWPQASQRHHATLVSRPTGLRREERLRDDPSPPAGVGAGTVEARPAMRRARLVPGVGEATEAAGPGAK
eukprot:15474995-Alexandrium_andersonii.AAC.1